MNDVSSFDSKEVSTATQDSAASSGAHTSLEPVTLSPAGENDGDSLLLEVLGARNNGVGGGRPGAVEPVVVVGDAVSTTRSSTVNRSATETRYDGRSNEEENTND